MGISKDTVETNAVFAKKHQFPFPLLSDTKGEVCEAFGACSESNVLRNTYVIGPNGKILRVFEGVHPNDQAETVLGFLHESSTATEQDRTPTNQVISQNFAFGNSINQRKGEQELMDEQQNDDLDAGQISKTVMADHQKAINEQSPEPMLAIGPSQIEPAQDGSGPSLVYALGMLDYNLVSEARRDSIMQHMDGNPSDPKQLLAYLDKNPSDAAAIIWTLNLDATPIYAIQPHGAFAREGYDRLRQFLLEQIEEGVERISVPGIIVGQVRLMSGQVVPIILPELRGMYSWTTAALVEAVCGKPPSGSTKAKDKDAEAYAEKAEVVSNFLERVYHELRNLGLTAQERAINYAASNVANAYNVFESALKKNLELHSIEVGPSPICRPHSDCWDIKLLFFDPENLLRAKTTYQFTINVSDVVPVMEGQMHFWSMP